MAQGATEAPRRGLSRFATELPHIDRLVTLGEGDTPVLPLPALAEHLKLGRLSAKLESYNPTGSYKDRVAALSISLARQQRKKGWIVTTSGNSGLAMAAYGARAGMPGLVCVVAEAGREKLLPLAAYPTTVVGVTGVGRMARGATQDELFQRVVELAEQHDLYLGTPVHAFNSDGMRAVDTIAFEMVEQAPSVTHVYVPTAGGGLLTGIARGLARREQSARMVACQVSGCAPIVHYLHGVSTVPKAYQGETGLWSLQMPSPPDGHAAAQAVNTSGGWGTVANDDEIREAQRLLAELEGIFVEPAAAVTVAALIKDAEAQRVEAYEHPVLVLSGAGWKDMGRLGEESGEIPVVEPGDLSTHVDKWAEQAGIERSE